MERKDLAQLKSEYKLLKLTRILLDNFLVKASMFSSTITIILIKIACILFMGYLLLVGGILYNILLTVLFVVVVLVYTLGVIESIRLTIFVYKNGYKLSDWYASNE